MYRTCIRELHTTRPRTCLSCEARRGGESACQQERRHRRGHADVTPGLVHVARHHRHAGAGCDPIRHGARKPVASRCEIDSHDDRCPDQREPDDTRDPEQPQHAVVRDQPVLRIRAGDRRQRDELDVLMPPARTEDAVLPKRVDQIRVLQLTPDRGGVGGVGHAHQFGAGAEDAGGDRAREHQIDDDEWRREEQRAAKPEFQPSRGERDKGDGRRHEGDPRQTSIVDDDRGHHRREDRQEQQQPSPQGPMQPDGEPQEEHRHVGNRILMPRHVRHLVIPCPDVVAHEVQACQGLQHCRCRHEQGNLPEVAHVTQRVHDHDGLDGQPDECPDLEQRRAHIPTAYPTPCFQRCDRAQLRRQGDVHHVGWRCATVILIDSASAQAATDDHHQQQRIGQFMAGQREETEVGNLVQVHVERVVPWIHHKIPQRSAGVRHEIVVARRREQEALGEDQRQDRAPQRLRPDRIRDRRHQRRQQRVERVAGEQQDQQTRGQHRAQDRQRQPTAHGAHACARYDTTEAGVMLRRSVRMQAFVH